MADEKGKGPPPPGKPKPPGKPEPPPRPVVGVGKGTLPPITGKGYAEHVEPSTSEGKDNKGEENIDVEHVRAKFTPLEVVHVGGDSNVNIDLENVIQVSSPSKEGNPFSQEFSDEFGGGPDSAETPESKADESPKLGKVHEVKIEKAPESEPESEAPAKLPEGPTTFTDHTRRLHRNLMAFGAAYLAVTWFGIDVGTIPALGPILKASNELFLHGIPLAIAGYSWLAFRFSAKADQAVSEKDVVEKKSKENIRAERRKFVDSDKLNEIVENIISIGGPTEKDNSEVVDSLQVENFRKEWVNSLHPPISHRQLFETWSAHLMGVLAVGTAIINLISGWTSSNPIIHGISYPLICFGSGLGICL